MKRFLICFLSLCFIASPTYASSKLGMTMAEFVSQYNAVSAPLGSPYIPLKDPDTWTVIDENDVGIFYPDNNKNIYICLALDGEKSHSSDVKYIVVMSDDPNQFQSVIAVTKRVLSLFDLSWSVTSKSCIVDCLTSYYEIGPEKENLVNTDISYYLRLSFGKSDTYYMFIIREKEKYK